MSVPYYPPQLLLLPIHVQHRLPPPLQSVELEPLLLLHTFLSLPISTYTVKPSYALPLALFGLVAHHLASSSSGAVGGSAILAHFQVLWLVSVLFDVVWLLYKGSAASSVVVFLVGTNMPLKVVSAGAVARMLESIGHVRLGPSFANGGGGGFAGLGSGSWGDARSIPGRWMAGGAGGSNEGYQSIYDDGQEEAAVGGYTATEDDAPPIASPVSAPRPSNASKQQAAASVQQQAQRKSDDKGGSYQTIA